MDKIGLLLPRSGTVGPRKRRLLSVMVRRFGQQVTQYVVLRSNGVGQKKKKGVSALDCHPTGESAQETESGWGS